MRRERVGGPALRNQQPDHRPERQRDGAQCERTVKPCALGYPAVTVEASTDAVADPPNAPPTVRVTVFMPVAIPVSPRGRRSR